MNSYYWTKYAAYKYIFDYVIFKNNNIWNYIYAIRDIEMEDKYGGYITG